VRNARFSAKPKNKQMQKEYEAQPATKQMRKEYRAQPEVKQLQKEYEALPATKQMRKDYRAQPEVKQMQIERDAQPARQEQKNEQIRSEHGRGLRAVSRALHTDTELDEPFFDDLAKAKGDAVAQAKKLLEYVLDKQGILDTTALCTDPECERYRQILITMFSKLEKGECIDTLQMDLEFRFAKEDELPQVAGLPKHMITDFGVGSVQVS
jgi:hypothetical protein